MNLLALLVPVIVHALEQYGPTAVEFLVKELNSQAPHLLKQMEEALSKIK